MTFDGVGAGSYERFMGRYSTPLAPRFADLALAGARPRPTVIDVGCGPGMLTAELARRTGEELISAVDPAASFVSATAARFPRADVRVASAEALPFADGEFDVAAAQLVVHFMDDPVAGVREMARVTRSGGPVAACVWDHHHGNSPLSLFWDTARRLDPEGVGDRTASWDEERLVGVLTEAGVGDVRSELLSVTVGFRDFQDWWGPFTDGVGPVGAYVDGTTEDRRAALETALRDQLGDEPFELTVGAWAAVGAAA